MAEVARPSPLSLTSPVQFLKGCGPLRAELLLRLDVKTVRDLAFLFPRDYDDLSDVRNIDSLEEGPVLSVVGTVDEIDQRQTEAGGSMLGILLRQGNAYLRGLWFNQSYLLKRFKHGQTLMLSGKARRKLNRWEMVHPVIRWLDEQTELPAAQILPVYPLTEGLQQRHVRRLVQAALEQCLGEFEEVFPSEYLAAHDLLPLREALPQVHLPESRAALAAARRRFVYQELLVMQLALALRRHQIRQCAAAVPLPASAKIDARIRRLFPYELTAAQNAAIAEIAADMAREIPMHRLLQGEVGSGKTAVAVYAMLLAVAHGAQAALMAPTEILARQHFDTLSEALSRGQVRLGLLSGSLSAKERRTLLAGAADGSVQIVVGTQALVESEVTFNRLGLVVVDEQHKFGVRQRATLRQSSSEPHYLVMTATPIPRTLGMTLYGDLDVSTLREGPPGRQPIHTYLPEPDARGRWWEFVCRKLREGRQAYVISPLVEETGEGELSSVESTYEALANGELADFRLGLVHGHLGGVEKQSVMAAFRRGDIQVLVATSIVEVGVDVANATLMTVFAPQRFGLAQLHQLRGRVGRGVHPGFCCLLADELSPEAKKRLDALLETTDGFRLAEIDFEMRGPGDLLGSRQHGFPPLRIADLARDAEVLAEVRRDAQALVEQQPGLAAPEFTLLRRMAQVRYGSVLDLADVG